MYNSTTTLSYNITQSNFTNDCKQSLGRSCLIPKGQNIEKTAVIPEPLLFSALAFIYYLHVVLADSSDMNEFCDNDVLFSISVSTDFMGLLPAWE